MDLMPWCEVHKTKRRRWLIAPSKQEILSSAKLLRIKPKQEHYKRLIEMIREAVKEFK